MNMTRALLHHQKNTLPQTYDPIIQDSKLTLFIFAIAVTFLLFAASVELTSWIGNIIPDASTLSPLVFIIKLFKRCGLLILFIYYGSRPSWRSACIVTTSGAIWTAIINYWCNPNVDFYTLTIAVFSINAFIALLLRMTGLTSSTQPYLYELRLRWLVGLCAIFIFVPTSTLGLTSSLHPKTLDLFAMQFDKLINIHITPTLVQWINTTPGGRSFFYHFYALVPQFMLIVALLQLDGRRKYVSTAVLIWVGMTTLALTAFHFFPITGPIFIFGPDFANQYTTTKPIIMSTIPVKPFPRNGLPSMHFGWILAACILWFQSETRLWSKITYVIGTLLMAMATLYTGEHYLMDLIVTLPFVLASIALCTTGIRFSFPARYRTVLLGFGTWLLWVILLRTEINFFMMDRWAATALVLLTFFVSAYQAYLISRFKYAPDSVLTESGGAQQIIPSFSFRKESGVTDHSPYFRQFGMMFFISGFAALIYQVLFAKTLALTFGSQSVATLTVLATFLGGMAVGSLLGGLIAHHIKKPLWIYAILEAGIGLYCLATPFIFHITQLIYVMMASGLPPDATSLIVLRVVLGALTLLLPTVLMGATLPVLTQSFGQHNASSVGARVAWLYFVNTAGASIGALLATYWIIPVLGVNQTIIITAMMNILIALIAIRIGQKSQEDLTFTHTFQHPLRTLTNPYSHLAAAFLALGIGGFLSLGLEVVYVHLLSIVAGNSVYAFGLMVATFLFGLSIGGETGRRILLSRIQSSTALPFVLLGMSLSVILNLSLWNSIPAYFAEFAHSPTPLPFAARETIRGIVCCLIMLPPTIFIGAAYALAMDIVTASTQRSPMILLGLGAMVNTLGNIIGVIVFGFVILPLYGGFNAVRIIAIAEFMLALFVMGLILRHHIRAALLTGSITLIALITSHAIQLDYDLISTGANVYFAPQSWGKVLAHTESIDGGLTTVNAQTTLPPVIHTLLTNGKFQGNDALHGEVKAQIAFAIAPLLHTTKRDHALVIGYGTGTTSRVLHDAGFKQLDIAELSTDIVNMANRFFEPLNHHVTQATGVQLHITDGRNFLLLSKEKYDLITLEISSIWFAGAASLYNKEFYQLAKQHLTSDGILQQWIQLHHLSTADVLMIISTLRQEFRYVSLYHIGSQGMLVATNAEQQQSANPDAIHRLQNEPRLKEERQLWKGHFNALKQDLLLSPNEIDNLLNHYSEYLISPASTDDNLYLEYNTPKGNALNATRSQEENLLILKQFQHNGTRVPLAGANK